MSEELKPCPFCGNTTLEENSARIMCNCGASMRTGVIMSPSDGHEKWNKRHTTEGYALVPVEPTEAMLRACKSAVMRSDARANYKAMLKAAQESD